MRQRKVLFPLLLWSGLILAVTLTWVWIGESKLTMILAIVSTFAALAPLLPTGPFSWLVTGHPSTPEQVDEAAEILITEVRRQWEEEARRRHLQEARQMPVRWRIDRQGSVSPQFVATSGELGVLVDEFTARPRPMLVVGEPGSGKTGLCVILALELLKEMSRDRVPVLLQVSSWNPSENFDVWLERRLLEDYPFLGIESRFGTTAVSDLVSQRRLLPILDGLDEMPRHLRAEALKAIEGDWSSDQPFVLTCRSREFEALRSAHLVPGTLMVRLLPLAHEAAAAYLRDAADRDPDRWDRVIAQLVDDPDGPLAHTLTKPLMLFLARTAYEAADSTPEEMLDPERFGDVHTLEKHLLDRFVPTVFVTRPPPPHPSPTRPARQWDPQVAVRTLAFLAHHLDRLGSRDLAWWRLRAAVPGSVFLVTRVVLGWIACALLGLLVFGLFGRPGLGVVLGSAIGVLAALPLGAVHEKQPRRFVPRLLRPTELAPAFLVRDIGFGVVGLLVGGLIVGLIYGPGYGVAIGLVLGLVFGLARRFSEPTESREPISPVGVLRGDRTAVLSAAGLGGLAGALVGGFLGGVVGGQKFGLVLELSSAQEGLLGAAVGLLLGAAGLGMIVHATSAWGQFTIARVWLALHGQVPLRLMLFLQDAHKLGVLRQIGPVYQFRHALLQDRLVGQLETAAGEEGLSSSSRAPTR